MRTHSTDSIISTVTPSLQRISHRLSHTTRRALGILLLCSSSIIGCDGPDLSTPSHSVSDNIVADVIHLGKDKLMGRYLTESTIALHVSREDLDEREGLSITSSDPNLLRLTSIPDSEPVFSENESCIGAACDRDQASPINSGHLTQYFEALAPGSVTLTFKDGDEVVLRREVQLVEASSLEVSRYQSDGHPQDVDPIAGRGEKILKGSSHTLRLKAKTMRDGVEEELDLATITNLPSVDGVQIAQSDLGFSKGINLLITPEREGQFTAPVEVGGARLELNFEVVDASQIDSLSVTHARAGEYQDEEAGSVPLASAVALARDEAGQPIFGGDVTWARLDDAELDELEVYYGDRLDFEFQEGQRVAFRVTMGDHSEVVHLPMNPDSNVLFGADAFNNGGCDATGQAAGRSTLLLVLLALIAFRRRAHA